MPCLALGAVDRVKRGLYSVIVCIKAGVHLLGSSDGVVHSGVVCQDISGIPGKRRVGDTGDPLHTVRGVLQAGEDIGRGEVGDGGALRVCGGFAIRYETRGSIAVFSSRPIVALRVAGRFITIKISNPEGVIIIRRVCSDISSQNHAVFNICIICIANNSAYVSLNGVDNDFSVKPAVININMAVNWTTHDAA